MPQARRKVPFSAKQKKLQIQTKREQKKFRNTPANSSGQVPRRFRASDIDGDIEDELDDSTQEYNDSEIITESNSGDQINPLSGAFVSRVHCVNAQKSVNSSRNVNRFALQFFSESDHDIRERKEAAQKPFDLLDEEKGLSCSIEDLYGETTDQNGIPVVDVDMPKRPEWSSSMSPQELHMQEQKYFTKYLKDLFSTFDSKKLSYFDLNLETWRQLWRVIEMSDIILLVSDARHPLFHFPPSLYHYVVDELGKDMILVVNKVDLIDSAIIVSWKEYFSQRFPKLNILEFASYAGMRIRSSSGKRVGKLRMAVKSAAGLQEMVSKIVKGKADLTSWKKKIDSELREMENVSMDDDESYVESDDGDEDKGNNRHKKGRTGLERRAEKIVEEKPDLCYYKHEEKYKDGIVTIGCVGHPNVGKSSLMNALIGRKVVSVSRTPGHTKHFQTIFLTDTVRLCDCPGLIFPSMAPKELQVLMGCYPISQLREPYTAIGYLCQRINLVRLLRLQHPEGDTETTWSAYDVCEAWAEKRGFLTARTSRPDIYRAANNILRMALDGRTICLAFRPPIYFEKGHDYWENHSSRAGVEAIQNKKMVEEELNRNLMRSSHAIGYVDSHASSVEGDLDGDEDDDDDDEDDDADDGLPNVGSKFACLDVDDDN